MWTWRSEEIESRPRSAERAEEWLRRGEECEQQHRVPSAIDAFRHAARSPDRTTAASACYHLGLLYEQQHHYKSALRAYRRAARSGDHETKASAYYHLGRLYEHRHRMTDAVATYRHAVRLNGSDSSRALEALARLAP
jgi:tetratricopeptide (TPR) repeat protein